MMVRYQALSNSSDVLACLLTVTGHMHPSLRGQRSLDPHGGTVRKETTYVGARVGHSHTEPEKVWQWIHKPKLLRMVGMDFLRMVGFPKWSALWCSAAELLNFRSNRCFQHGFKPSEQYKSLGSVIPGTGQTRTEQEPHNHRMPHQFLMNAAATWSSGRYPSNHSSYKLLLKGNSYTLIDMFSPFAGASPC